MDVCLQPLINRSPQFPQVETLAELSPSGEKCSELSVLATLREDRAEPHAMTSQTDRCKTSQRS